MYGILCSCDGSHQDTPEQCTPRAGSNLTGCEGEQTSAVSTTSGQTALKRMPFSFSAGAADRMKLKAPALAAQYVGGELQCGPRPATDAVSRMLPASNLSSHHTSPA